jgi:hypothetical protein
VAAGRHWDAPFLAEAAEASRPLVADGRDLHRAWAQAFLSAAHAAVPAPALLADDRAAVQEAAVVVAELARAAAAPEAGSAEPAALVLQVAAAEVAARDAPRGAAGVEEPSVVREAAR